MYKITVWDAPCGHNLVYTVKNILSCPENDKKIQFVATERGSTSIYINDIVEIDVIK